MMRWAALFAAALATPALAQSLPPPEETAPDTKAVPAQDSVPQVPLLGRIPAREALADKGIALTGHLIGEVAANARGVGGSGATYVNHLDLGAVIDLKKLGVARAGTVRVVFSDRLGTGLHERRTRGYIQYQAFTGQGRNARFDEISYETPLIDKRLSLKAGFYAMGNDFGGLPYVCNFNNNGNCGHPLGLLYGSGWVDNPTGQWGCRLKWTDRSGWYVQVGAYDVTPVRKRAGHGFDLGFDGTTGVIVPLEIGLNRGKVASDLSGTYKIGLYYDSSRVAALGQPGRMVRGRVGGYVQIAQQVLKIDAERHRGIALFGVATLNDRATGLFRTTYEFGTSFRGPIASRSKDVLSASWVRVDVNRRLVDSQRAGGAPPQSDEQLFEFNYALQATPSIIVRPSLQYVIHPGAYAARPSSIVGGLHLGVTL